MLTVTVVGGGVDLTVAHSAYMTKLLKLFGSTDLVLNNYTVNLLFAGPFTERNYEVIRVYVFCYLG